MTTGVLILAPSRGLGGGIERYGATVEFALTRHGVPWRRIDLLRPGGPQGKAARVAFVREVRRAVRDSEHPVRLVIAHRNLLPVLHLVSRDRNFAGATVVLHGNELWSGRRGRCRRLLRHPAVRVVAGSSFTAGAAAHLCRARVLPPGVDATWYDALVRAGARVRPGSDPIHLVTAFRLAGWRDKGLDVLLEALRPMGSAGIRLTVCGTGPVPAGLAAAVRDHAWCRLAPDLTDTDLAGRLAGADLFALCTRTRAGHAAAGEGFGLVLLEAQLAGTPVVAPAHGGSQDAFLPDVTGVAPTDESPAALRRVLVPLLADAGRRAELGRAAAEWSRARFAPAAHSERVVQVMLGDAIQHEEGQ